MPVNGGYEPPPPYGNTFSTSSTTIASPFSPQGPDGGPKFPPSAPPPPGSGGPPPPPGIGFIPPQSYIAQQPLQASPTAFILPNSTATLIVSSAGAVSGYGGTPTVAGGGMPIGGGNGGGGAPVGVAGGMPTLDAVVNGAPVKVIFAAPLGPDSVCLECGNCRQTITTRVVPRSGLLTWLLCGGLALVGCWPCCLMPFCISGCQDADHFCPQCNAFLGRFRRI